MSKNTRDDYKYTVKDVVFDIEDDRIKINKECWAADSYVMVLIKANLNAIPDIYICGDKETGYHKVRFNESVLSQEAKGAFEYYPFVIFKK